MLTSGKKLCEKSGTNLAHRPLFGMIRHRFGTRNRMKIIVRLDQNRRKNGHAPWLVETNLGKRKRKYFKTRSEAYEYKREFEQPFLDGLDENSPSGNMRLSTALFKHIKNLQARGAREETITSRKIKGLHFVKHLNDPCISKVTRQIFKEYILTKNKESTRKTTRSEVGGFLNWCHETDLTPVHFYKVKWEYNLEDEKLVECLTPDDARQLMEAIPDGYKVAMAMCLFAGIRPYEVPRIKWQYVYPDKNLIIIEGTSAKTRRNRKLTDLPDNLWEWIRKYKKHSMGKVGPINRYRMLAKYRKKACIECGILYPHDGARHSFGSYGYWHGGKEWAMRLMGHNNEKVFNQHYLDTGITRQDAKKYFSVSPA